MVNGRRKKFAGKFFAWIKPEAGKGVPLARPYNVGVRGCLSACLDRIHVESAEHIVVVDH